MLCRALLLAAHRTFLRNLTLWLCVGAPLLCSLQGCEEEPGPLPVIAQVPAFELQDQRGAEVSAATLRGTVWVANFIFTSCPDICPLLTKKMNDLRTGLVRKGVDVRFVSFTVDPQTDTPQVLHDYAEKHRANHADWFFLTGSLERVKDVVVSGFKQVVERDSEQQDNILHGSHFVLVDRALAVRGFYRSDADGLLSLSQAAARLAQDSSP